MGRTSIVKKFKCVHEKRKRLNIDLTMVDYRCTCIGVCLNVRFNRKYSDWCISQKTTIDSGQYSISNTSLYILSSSSIDMWLSKILLLNLGVICKCYSPSLLIFLNTLYTAFLHTYCILLTVYYLLYTNYCILLTVYYLLYVTYCILLTVYYLLYTTNCILLTVYYLLYTTYCILLTAYY